MKGFTAAIAAYLNQSLQRGVNMGSLYKREDRYDEIIRLEQAIKSNKRYLQELNKNKYQKNSDDMYSALIKNQELLLRELSE